MKAFISVRVAGKVVEIAIKPDTARDELKIINCYVADNLEIMIEEENVKYYKNRLDFLVVMPQNGVLPEELKLDIEKRLGF